MAIGDRAQQPNVVKRSKPSRAYSGSAIALAWSTAGNRASPLHGRPRHGGAVAAAARLGQRRDAVHAEDVGIPEAHGGGTVRPSTCPRRIVKRASWRIAGACQRRARLRPAAETGGTRQLEVTKRIGVGHLLDPQLRGHRGRGRGRVRVPDHPGLVAAPRRSRAASSRRSAQGSLTATQRSVGVRPARGRSRRPGRSGMALKKMSGRRPWSATAPSTTRVGKPSARRCASCQPARFAAAAALRPGDCTVSLPARACAPASGSPAAPSGRTGGPPRGSRRPTRAVLRSGPRAPACDGWRGAAPGDPRVDRGLDRAPGLRAVGAVGEPAGRRPVRRCPRRRDRGRRSASHILDRAHARACRSGAPPRGSTNSSRPIVVWRPRSSSSRTSRTSWRSSPRSALVMVDLPTPDDPSSATVAPATT